MELLAITSPMGEAIVELPREGSIARPCSITFQDFTSSNFQSFKMWFTTNPASLAALDSLIAGAVQLRHALKGDPLAVTINITRPVVP